MRGLLLDSGDTLMHPRGGRWNPRFDFEEIVARHFPAVEAKRFPEAFAEGDRFLLDWDNRATDSGSRKARAAYHRVILSVLGLDEPSAELLEELDRPLPFAQIVEPFDDVEEGLRELRGQGWAIAIVANAGVGMIEVYRRFRLDSYIDAFVMSEEIGVSKPNHRMYHAGSEALGFDPADCVFVDDSPMNLRTAVALGYHALGISRYQDPPEDELQWVRNLTELASLLYQFRDARG